MPALINKTEVIEDTWHTLDEAAVTALIAGGHEHPQAPLLHWADWLTVSEQLAAPYPAPLGVIVPNTTEPQEILRFGGIFSLIAIEFPVFTDGRGYSLARMLREQGYTGELRAVGDVLPDQLFYMARCGFDTFALKAGKDAADALAKFNTFSVTYQAAADIEAPIYQR